MPFAFRLIILLLATLLAPGASAADPGRPVRVAVIEVEPVDHSITLPEKVGLLEAANSMSLSFEVPGRVERIFGQGARVSQGDEIAALDADLERAELRRADLLLRDAHQELKRVRGLKASNAASARELDAAVIQVGLREAERDAARERLQRRQLHARFDGIVAELEIEPGEVASPGVPVARLLNFDLMRLEVGVPGHQIARVRPGARAWASIAALGGSHFEGVVHEVAPSASDSGTLFEVDILVPNGDGRLRPGMTARAIIEVRVATEALVIPFEVSVEREGSTVVFFVEEGRARAVPVDAGTRHGARLILEGESGQHLLVVRGQHDLEDGLQVEIDNSVISDLEDSDRFRRMPSVADRTRP